MKNIRTGSVLASVALVSAMSFSALTALAAGPGAVNLGSAGNFTVLAKSAISTTGTTAVKGDVGVSPAAATFITGFGLTAATDTTYSTSPIITGKVYAADYSNPTPATLTTAILDMQTAYTDAAGRTNPDATELGAGNIGGMTLAPGLYKWGTGVTIPTDVTLSGGANDIWIFQVAQTLTVSSGAKVILNGGAQASNVFWVVAGQVTLGTTAEMNGVILSKTAIVLNTGAKLTGKALAQTAVTLDANAVTGVSSGSTVSAPASPTPTTPTTPTPVTPAPVVPVPATPATVSGSATSQGSSSSNSSGSTAVSGNSMAATSVTPAPAMNNTNSNNAPAAASSFGQQVRMIAVNLSKGSSNTDVAALQNFLISQGRGPAARALGAVGATAYFGNLTRSALAEFQAQVGISPAVGYFGAITRGYISSHNQ